MSVAPPPASPLEALKAGFRRACVRRLVGDEGGAVEVLRDEIPGLVVNWAKSTSLDPAEKKSKLKEMFDDESSRADELAVAFDLFAGRFETRLEEIIQKEVGHLAERIDTVTQGLKDTLGHVGELALKLNNTESLVPEPSVLVEPIKEGAETEKHSSADLQDKRDEDLIPKPAFQEKKEISDELALFNENMVDDSPVKNTSVNPLIHQSKELDPPSGTGLRFDEIEEMIDEILSYETN